jgi:hypothetical protein
MGTEDPKGDLSLPYLCIFCNPSAELENIQGGKAAPSMLSWITAMQRPSALLLLTILILIPVIPLAGATEAGLENLLSILRNQDSMETRDRAILQEVLSKFKANEKLSVLEDNVLYHYIKSKNSQSHHVSSPIDSDFQVYKRFDGLNYSFAVEEFRKDGIVHQILDLKEEEPTPYSIWSPTDLYVLFVYGDESGRNIFRYAPKKQAFSPLVNSQYDDFSPLFHPSGRYMVFLSNRDREYVSDTRTALYLVDLIEPFAPLKISGLNNWKANTSEVPGSIRFTSKEVLLASNQTSSDEILFSTIMKDLQEAREIERKKAAAEERKKAKTQAKKQEIQEAQTVLNLESGNRSARIQRKDEILTLEIKNSPEEAFRKISTMPSEYLSSPRGPAVVLKGSYLFFRKLEGGHSRIYLYKDGRVQSVSMADENCYGIAWDLERKLLAYLIDRSGTFYLMVQALDPTELVLRKRVEGVFSGPSEEMVRIEDEDRFLVRNSLGDLTAVEDSFEAEDTESKQTDTRRVNPIYEAPFQISKSLWLPPDSGKKRIQPEAAVWRVEEIQREMSKMTESIRWISTGRELIELKERFNIVREQVQIWIGRWDRTGDATLRHKAIRWMEEINGIKYLITNAQILIDIE